MSRSTVARATAVGVASLAVAVGGWFTPASQAAPQPAYVALGDSYSSGVGTRSYIDDGTTCKRSVYAYPTLISTASSYALNFRACSGAEVADVRDAQLGALSSDTEYVSISVGGNDAGFADVLTECAQPSWLSNCPAAISAARTYISDVLPGDLATLYQQIRAGAPNATVSVVGYPRIFNGTDCNALTWFSGSEMRDLNATADLINTVTFQRASTAGFAFADPTSRFRRHAVCDSPEWINGLSSPISESYHPNRAGHADGYTPTVSPTLGGKVKGGGGGKKNRRDAARLATALAEQQRQYSELDAGIEPETFTAPDLHSPRAQRVAERLGIDVDDPASLRRAERRFAD